MLNCTREKLVYDISTLSFPFTKLDKELRSAGDSALRSGNTCGGVTLLFLSGCYGNSDTFFTIAALFQSGVLLPRSLSLVSSRSCSKTFIIWF